MAIVDGESAQAVDERKKSCRIVLDARTSAISSSECISSKGVSNEIVASVCSGVSAPSANEQ